MNLTITNDMVDARQLHSELKSKRDFSTWIREKIKQADLQEGKDYSPRKGKTTVGRPTIDYEITVDAAKEICLLQQTPEGHIIRRKLIELSKQVESHKLLNTKLSALAYNMLNTFKFAEYQIQAEDIHKGHFVLTAKTRENVHKAFAEYRGELLGINNNDLKQGLIDAFNNGMISKASAKNVRGRIALIDKYKLIRDAVADFLIGTGATTFDALNFADTVKEIAEFAQIEIKIKDEDNLFQEKENVLPPLLNLPLLTEIKKLKQ